MYNNNLKYMDDFWIEIIEIFVIDFCGFLFYSIIFFIMVIIKKIRIEVIKNKKNKYDICKIYLYVYECIFFF